MTCTVSTSHTSSGSHCPAYNNAIMKVGREGTGSGCDNRASNGSNENNSNSNNIRISSRRNSNIVTVLLSVTAEALAVVSRTMNRT